VIYRRPCILAAAVVIAFGFAAVSAVAPLPAGAASSTQASTTSPIKHVIVVMQSGHSFDSYFGTRHGVSGIPPGVCLTLVAGSPGCIKPYHLDPDQSRAGLSDTFGVTQRSINGGKMDGFVRAKPNASIGATSMGYLNRQDLPYYWNLADRFTLYDQFFTTSRAGALPNRVAAVAGQDGGLTGGTVPAAGITTPTVFDQLDHAGLSWKYYVENYKGSQQGAVAGQQSEAPVLAMPAITGDSARASHIVDTNQYFDDLLNGKLPAVSYVAGTVDSERSPLNPTLGEFFVKSLINALMQSSAWKDTVLLFTYDSSGGWYDNVPPPVMGGVAQGIRVPMLMVSPFARAGVVDHSVLNTTAIPGMIDQVFGLPVLTPQTAAAGSLLSGADLKQAPIAPLIALLPGGATVASRPDVLVVYGLYLLMFLAAGLLAGLAFRRYRRSEAAPDGSPELGAIRPPAGEDNGFGEDANETSTEHSRVTSDVRATLVADDKAAGHFRLADVTNPYQRGTPEHDAWRSPTTTSP
jgi:phospholipase C